MKKHVLNLLLLLCICLACHTPKARKPIASKSGSFIKESVKRNKELIAQEEDLIKNLIKVDSTNSYYSSNTGFWYYYQKKDSISTELPVYGDHVNFDFDIKDLNGNTIYTRSETANRTIIIDKEELFFGLREGLKLMKAGEEVTFLFPSYQAYGYYGDENKIGRNKPILVNVSLNSIKKEKS